jgi:hypothetical protein
MTNKILWACLMILLLSAQSGENKTYHASLLKVYSIDKPPEQAVFNAVDANLIAAENLGGEKYIIDKSKDKVIKTYNLIGFFDKYALVLSNPNLPDTDFLIYDPYKWQKTDLALTLDDRLKFLDKSASSAVISLKAGELKPDKIQFKNKSTKYENSKLSNKIIDGNGKVVYTLDREIWDPVASHDGYKYIFADKTREYSVLDISTGKIMEIPLHLDQFSGKAVTKYEGDPKKLYKSAITNCDVDARWFWDNSTIFLHQICSDHDDATLIELFYIYEMFGNRLTKVELPAKIMSPNSEYPDITLGDISTEGKILLLKDKLYEIAINWQ